MKKKIRFTGFTFAMVAATVLSACGQQQQKSEQSQEAKAAAPAFSNEQQAAAYEHYIHLKDALVASSEDEARAAAGALKTALQEIPEADKAMQAATSVAEVPDMEAQRTAFAELSNAMADLLKASDITSGKIYLAFCPMANNNAGAYWLASEKEIRNPYFGDQMLKCGEVRETLD